MVFDEALCRIALSLIPNIGPVLARKLVAHCGSAAAVFAEKKSLLQRIPGIGQSSADAVVNSNVFARAEEELKFMEKNGITALYYQDDAYPRRLKHCYDAPVVLYHLGNTNFNNPRVVGVVGTRHATDYGGTLCEKLVQELAPYDVLLVSGLAIGIDSIAHRAALGAGLQTLGALGHGLDRIYPLQNRGMAKKMLAQGGLLTEFISGTNPDRENFPARNRVVAGLSDCVVVVESAAEGGSLITAEYAVNYNRDVFAFPGRVGDERSAGCNALIRSNKAALIESAEDLVRMMGWEDAEKKPAPQPALPVHLEPEEERVVDSMRDQGNVYIDEICSVSGLTMSKVAAVLLKLEFSGVVKALPGKMYRLN